MPWDEALLLGALISTFVCWVFVFPLLAAMEDEDKNGRD